MRLAKQLFQKQYLVDANVEQYNTSELLARAPFFYFSNPGVPIYLPIGAKILRAIETRCFELMEQLDFNCFEMPQLIPNDSLELGEDFHEGFLNQFVFLNDRLRQFHLLSTPEPFFIHLLKQGLQSYRQIPLQFFFSAKFYRQLRGLDGILKTREFKMLAGMSLVEAGERSGSIAFSKFMKKIEQCFGLKLQCYFDPEKKYHEYFYPHIEGSEQYQGKPAISLAMFYQYARQKKLNTTYRTASNRNQKADLITFGLGLQRLFFVIMDACRDHLGFKLPKEIRPFDIAIIPTGDTSFLRAEQLFEQLSRSNKKVVFDDRHDISIQSKCKLADFLGVSTKMIVKPDGCVNESRIELESENRIVLTI